MPLFKLVLVLVAINLSCFNALAEKPKREDLGKAPVKIVLSEENLKDLTPEQKASARAIAAIMEKHLFTWTNLEIELPETIFGNEEGQIIELGDLFKAPTSDEVGRLGGGKFSEAQLEQIRQEGLFIVPSQDYPGQYHLWKFSAWFQTGSKNIEIWFDKRRGDALGHLIIKLPARIWGNEPLSIRRGLRNFYHGLRETFGLFVGLTETQRKYQEHELDAIVEQERRKFQVVQSGGMSQDGRSRDGLDLRLYDAELMSKAVDLLGRIEAELEREWETGLEALTRRIGEELKAENVPDAEFGQLLVNRLVQAKQDALFERILNDPRLEQLGGGLGRLIVNHGRATQLILHEERRFAERVESYARRLTESLKAQHPDKARVPAWLEREVSESTTAFYRGQRWYFYSALPEMLRARELDQEARLLEQDIEFYKRMEPQVRGELEQLRESAASFEYSRKIWNKDRWRVVKDEQGRFSLEKRNSYEVHTGSPGWRLKNLWFRGFTRASNWMHGLLVENLYNGPVGFRSLFGLKPFAYKWNVDSKTGERVVVAERQTMVSRIKSLWKSRRDLLAEYDKSPERGFFKLMRRIALFWKADVARGVVGPMLVATGQPVVTAVNAVFGGTLSAGTLVFAPLTSMFQFGFHAAIYDVDGTNYPPARFPRKLVPGLNPRFLPIVSRIVGQAGIAGVGETAASAVGVFYHPAMAVGHYGLGAAGRQLRTGLDTILRKALVRWAEVPNDDVKYVVRRVQGPGLSARYFYQVSPDLVLVALQAQLEADALHSYFNEAKWVINDPVQALDASMEIFRALYKSPRSYEWESPAVRGVTAEVDADMKELGEKTKVREQKSRDLLNVPKKGEIVLAQADYEPTVQKAVVQTRHFYERMFADRGYSARDIEVFWATAKVQSGDWAALTRQLLVKTFGDAIARPLEETDLHLRVEVKTPDLEDIARGIEEALPADEVEQVKVEPIKRDKLPQPTVEYVNTSKLCEGLMSGKSMLDRRFLKKD